MLVLDSELTRPSNDLDVIEARQAKLQELLLQAEQEGASPSLVQQLRFWIERWDRQRQRILEAGDELL